MDNLPELRDIHLPNSITLFPLGYGVLTFVLLLFFGVVFFFVLRRLILRSKKHYALEIIQKIESANTASLCKISEMLRRICKIKHKKAVCLYGNDWADFLNNQTDLKLPLSQLELLIRAPYAPSTSVLNTDFEQIKKFALHWVEVNL